MPQSATIPDEFAALDLTFEKHKLSKDFGWSWDFVESVYQEYLKFLVLVKQYPQIKIVPSSTIDKLWHLHILDTQRYELDCMRLFSRFLHHEPDRELISNGRGGQQYKVQAWRETLVCYKEHFGAEPPTGEWGDKPPCGPPGEIFLTHL